MTRAQISSLVLSWLDDEQQGYFNANDVNTWINLAHRQVQLELLQAGHNWYMKPAETLTVVGQSDYIFPSDFIELHRVEIVISGTGATENRQALQQMTLMQQDLCSVVLGTPTNYYLKKDRFTLMPTPNQAWTMRLYYSPIVSDLLSDTDVPDVPEEFMEYVALLAAYNGFIKDDRAPANLVMKMNQYRELFKQMAVDRATDQSRQVVMVNEYDYGAWF